MQFRIAHALLNKQEGGPQCSFTHAVGQVASLGGFLKLGHFSERHLFSN